ncbi:hypothetical protein Gpo141_00010933 [Globisporangium polare]
MMNESSGSEDGRTAPRRLQVDAADAFPETIAPTVSLTKELEALYMFLVHQKATHSTADREYAELAQLSEKELDAKVRELENWNFRLNLDEAKEISESVAMGILSAAQTPRNTHS